MHHRVHYMPFLAYSQSHVTDKLAGSIVSTLFRANFDIESLTGHVRYNATRLPALHPKFPPLIVGRNFTAPWYPALCELWVLDHLFHGAVRTSHGVPRKKVRNRNFLRWAPISVAQSHWLTAAFRNRKENLRSSQQQRLLRMWGSRNLMRWDGRFTSCDFSDVHQLAGNSQSVVPKKTDYAIATVKEVLTLAQSTAPVIPVPFLKEVISVALKIIQLCEVRWVPPLNVPRNLIKFLRKHRMLNKKSKSCKVGLEISWSLLWTT